MAKNDNDRILSLRNEASLYLDDLAALAVNSALALDLRLFSEEIMELTPGFTFSLRQAAALRDLTQKTLKQYQASPISDGEMMNRLAQARAILKNEETKNGGNLMGFFDKIVHGKELQKQENARKLEAEYKSICDQIADCEEEMDRCVDACAGLSPSSMTYRSNMRAYNAAENKLKLLRQQEQQFSSVIGGAERMKMLQEAKERQEKLKKMASKALGSEKERERTLAEMEINNEALNATVQAARDFGSEVFDQAEAAMEEVRPDSDFDAKVAARERRRAALEMAGESQPEPEKQDEENLSEFDRKVRARSQKNDQE